MQDSREECKKEAQQSLKMPLQNIAPEGMVLVKGGTYKMGCIDEYYDCANNEKPLHTVSLDDFFIDEKEVTNAQFCLFLNERGNQEEEGNIYLDINSEFCLIEKRDSGFYAKSSYDDHPVIQVTWYGANDYAKWVGKRLPTEAEWEYAARSEGNDDIWSGVKIRKNLTDYANLRRSLSNATGKDDGYSRTAPVGSFSPNSIGLYDMSGNVNEWCSDWYNSDYYKVSDGLKNPKGPESGSSRILRGGSWASRSANCRSSYRNKSEPDAGYSDNGFRCVKSKK